MSMVAFGWVRCRCCRRCRSGWPTGSGSPGRQRGGQEECPGTRRAGVVAGMVASPLIRGRIVVESPAAVPQVPPIVVMSALVT